MTPSQRQTNNALRWLKTSIRETLRIAKNLEEKMSAFDDDAQIEAQKIITDLRQQAKRCSHHGLGISVQELLPLKPKE
jgi:hypothetical protein